MTAEFVVLVLALAAILAIAGWALALGSPPLPSGGVARAGLVALIPDDLPAGAVYELGAGWGGLALDLARALPERRVIAVEASPLPWLVARLRALGRENLSVRFGRIEALNLSGASLVAVYLGPKPMARLSEKLRAELPPRSVLLSNGFALADLTPERTVDLPTPITTTLYRYRMGETG